MTSHEKRDVTLIYDATLKHIDQFSTKIAQGDLKVHIIFIINKEALHKERPNVLNSIERGDACKKTNRVEVLRLKLLKQRCSTQLLERLLGISVVCLY